MAMKQKNLPEVVPKFFEHEQFGEIRFIQQNGELWFVAVDLCRALDIKNSRDAVSNLDDDEKMTVILIDNCSKNGVMNTVGNNDGIRGAVYPKNGVTNTVSNTYGTNDATFGGWIENRVTVVSEPGLYRLIFMSRKPEAKKFKRWVFHEVLPSIRKYGYYVAPNQKVISIKGAANFKKFKAQYPEGAVEVKNILLGANEPGEYRDYLKYEVVLRSDKLIGGEQGRTLPAS